MKKEIVHFLNSRGVELIDIHAIYLGDEVDLERINGPGTVVFPGCKLTGSDLFIAPGCKIGTQGPVTVENCRLAPDVELKGGYFQGSVFLKGASLGPEAHIRKGTIIEEMASVAHAVGLKQTILFPYVTLGSLINFCDCFMAGGTGPENHSEVGSSYIHFNFTPNQDKATPSLIGDVPRGVMLRENPIFLGGQGGLVGPSRLAFGTVVAAGTIYRKDQLKPNRLLAEPGGRSINLPYKPGTYTNIKRILKNNLLYIANLAALEQWYLHVRSFFVGGELPEQVYRGLLETLTFDIEERISRLGQLASKAQNSASGGLHGILFEKWPQLENILKKYRDFKGDPDLMEKWLLIIESLQTNQLQKHSYITGIKSLSKKHVEIGINWLDSIVMKFMEAILKLIPEFELNV